MGEINTGPADSGTVTQEERIRRFVEMRQAQFREYADFQEHGPYREVGQIASFGALGSEISGTY